MLCLCVVYIVILGFISLNVHVYKGTKRKLLVNGFNYINAFLLINYASTISLNSVKNVH